MERTYWHKQTKDKPLFPDMLWARPENRQAAGKLLIIGGNLHGFSAPAQAYSEAEKAGIGTTRIILPNAIKKLVGPIMTNGEFTASTPSGSFSQQALGDLLDFASWSDGILFAGNLGRNSETAILIETFLAKNKSQVTLTKDAVNYIVSTPLCVASRPNTTLVLTLGQLQKLATGLGFKKAITFSMDFLQLIEVLHEFTSQYPINIVVKQHRQIIVACGGQVASTKLETDMAFWCVQTAAHASVWWAQNPTKPFEALATSLIAD